MLCRFMPKLTAEQRSGGVPHARNLGGWVGDNAFEGQLRPRGMNLGPLVATFSTGSWRTLWSLTTLTAYVNSW
jgi:hypothetical protein